VTPHAYQEDTRRKALRWAFLGRGSVPPDLDEDDPTIMIVALPMANMNDGTCEILGK
jgi:hypothetical protein